ncbi:MAG: tetratricopeptide repeat protein [Desulfatibacillum sp.]|nr:tetratricopeptide repeat protein [Desulfatibacillum sp.]
MKSNRGRLNLLTAAKAPLAIAFLGFLIIVSIQGCASKSSPNVGKQVEATRELGVVLMNEGQSRAALREFLKAEQLDPKNVKVQDYLGLVLLTLGRPQEALEHFNQAVKLDPGYLSSKNNLGCAYLELEQWDNAITVFQDLLADLTYPTPWKPAANLGWAYFSKGDLDKAREYYLMSVDQSPGYAQGWRGLGKVYLEDGNSQKALYALEKAVLLAPNFAEAYFELGEAYLRSGHRSKAQQAWDKVCVLTPDSEVCAKATAKIRTLQTTW